MAHHDIFRDQLAIAYPSFGHALWEPDPGDRYPPVEVGDVGFVRRGKFHRLFNALLHANHPSHVRYGVPENYEPLQPRILDHVDSGTLKPNDLYSSGINIVSGGLEVLASGAIGSAEVSFSCTKKHGAILSLPVTARRQDTVVLGHFRKWIVKHIDTWFAFTQELGLGIEMEDIVLVTGCHRTRSWSNVALNEVQTNVQLSLGVDVAGTFGANVNWRVSNVRIQGAVHNHGPSGDNLLESQCIFIRGFRVKRIFGIIPWLKAAAEHKPDSPGNDRELEKKVVPIPSDTEYRDPLHVLLEYIAKQAPHCHMALVHDNDLEQILGFSDRTPLESLQPGVVMDYLQSLKLGIGVMANSFPADYQSSGTDTEHGDMTVAVAMLSGENANTIQQNAQHNPHLPAPPTLTDLAGRVKGMYRLLDLIGETGSNGYVDKVIISQDSLQHFINAVSPGAYTSITKVDFKTLDQFMIKPLGVYGSKDEIVRLLRSIGAVDKDIAMSLLAPSDVGNSRETLSSGLYIVKASATDVVGERHYVIYWPEDSTWNDSATSSVRRNRVTFMRYLTKICDQVVALLSPEQSASIIWNDEQSDAESADMDIDDDWDRPFTFSVAKTNEQEESAVTRPGFQMNSRYILACEPPPDCPVDPAILAPRLLPGEMTYAFWTATYVPRQTRAENFDERILTQVTLKQLLMNSTFVLSETLDENAVRILVGVAIAERFPGQCDKWRARNQGAPTTFMHELMERKETVRMEVIRGEGSLRRVLHEAVVGDVMGLFPSLERDRLSQASHPRPQVPNANQGAEDSLRLSDLESLYPDFRGVYNRHVQNARFGIALRRDSYFENRKLRLVAVRHLLDKHQDLPSQTRSELIQALLKGDFYRAQNLLPKTDGKKPADSGGWDVGGIFPGGSSVSLSRDMRTLANSISDSQFLLDMKGIADAETQSAIQEIEALAHAQLASAIDATMGAMTRNVLAMQQDYCTRSIQHEMENEERKSLNNALVEFIRDVNAQSSGPRDSVVYIDGVIALQSVGWRDPAGYYDDVEVEWGTHIRSHYGQVYLVTGRQEVLQEPRLEYWVYPMDLTSDDKHNMQLDSKYIPQPTVNNKLSSAFHLPIGVNIAFCQVLEGEKLLLILIDKVRVAIYLERLPAMDMAIERHRPIKVLNREKLEQDILFAFDETKRTLAVCAPSKLQFHMFVFDETFKTLQGQGGGISLAPWYSQAAETSITHIAFVCEAEELVFVDSGAQARIFSFVSMQFRPASLQLPSPPSAIFSSPDGACLLTLHTRDEQPSLTAYHWETFGSTTGIALDVPKFPLQGAVLTSLVHRGSVFLLGLDVDVASVKSIAINITKKLTELMFKENGSRNASNNKARHTLHNSLLDCHAEVWSRYPVLAAVKRRTVTSLSERKQKSLTFITENDSQPFNIYFSDLIQTFERTTRKPTGDELRRIKVSAERFGVFTEKVILDPDWDMSRYRVGEWLVDVFCLIPIHIAVCRENRFVPLANGVLSSDLERTLLGAEANKIVDKLSFGWYESIFQSYMATKPVKVVSSMGQQSVGKSFSLNHLLDTSFSGSAMQTTEGVWMSVTPTDDALIVALDFEGVDSVERSLREDALLVLFNTAISNLVLFRNNFAFSRDISGLFQSFQSSASVLDPAVNPSLFQSTLVIIIKDVVESDKVEITREFSLKIQKIVQQEQSANFISRLHRGRLNIIPWPVIELKEFYNLFSALRRLLDLQSVSYPTAGEFLHTIKTLMTKLKANDWGALSQTMTEPLHFGTFDPADPNRSDAT